MFGVGMVLVRGLALVLNLRQWAGVIFGGGDETTRKRIVGERLLPAVEDGGSKWEM